jgi:nucleoside-diphosphate-sugar epimerase
MQEASREFSHLLILGATGRVGQTLLRQALASGRRVTVIVRDPARFNEDTRQDITAAGDRLRIIVGDASEAGLFEQAFDSDVDAVLSVLGIFNRKPGTPLTDITGGLLQAMQQHGVRRLVNMSSLGVGSSAAWGGMLEQYVIRIVLRHVLKDKLCQEKLIEFSGLDWTLLRPPRILPGEGSRDYLCWREALGVRRPAWKISRYDAAREMLNLLEKGSAIGETWHISY